MRKNKPQKKTLIIAIFIAVLLVIIIVDIIFLINKKQGELQGTIDCQPPLVTEYEIDLCRRAEEAGYPNIVY